METRGRQALTPHVPPSWPSELLESHRLGCSPPPGTSIQTPSPTDVRFPSEEALRASLASLSLSSGFRDEPPPYGGAVMRPDVSLTLTTHNSQRHELLRAWVGAGAREYGAMRGDDLQSGLWQDVGATRLRQADCRLPALVRIDRRRCCELDLMFSLKVPWNLNFSLLRWHRSQLRCDLLGMGGSGNILWSPQELIGLVHLRYRKSRGYAWVILLILIHMTMP